MFDRSTDSVCVHGTVCLTKRDVYRLLSGNRFNLHDWWRAQNRKSTDAKKECAREKKTRKKYLLLGARWRLGKMYRTIRITDSLKRYLRGSNELAKFVCEGKHFWASPTDMLARLSFFFDETPYWESLECQINNTRNSFVLKGNHSRSLPSLTVILCSSLSHSLPPSFNLSLSSFLLFCRGMRSRKTDFDYE